MQARVPVILYGSDSNPEVMREKMTKYGPADLQSDLQTIPQISGFIPDARIVWQGQPGHKGGIFVELYKGDDTVGQKAHCTVAFMDQRQLAVMHATAGVTYQAALVSASAGSDARELEALAYVVRDPRNILLRNGRPIPVAWPGEIAEPGAITAEQAINYMLLKSAQVDDAINARELVKLVVEHNNAGRRVLPRSISHRLHKLGLKRAFSYPASESERVGRADFNGLVRPHYGLLRLMEEVVAPLRPDSADFESEVAELITTKGLGRDQAIAQARKNLDIAEKLRERARIELAARLPKRS